MALSAPRIEVNFMIALQSFDAPTWAFEGLRSVALPIRLTPRADVAPRAISAQCALRAGAAP
jgi:hypothetical protein